ncbi:LemA family protein [Acholeplasma granularum]|uniref:LemA family protein n=1 Tax=Acholeplasma granularum TaxID=264635 RepID=UPI000470999A|nr:LemA family protein [Acholeplasma granularum]
MEKLLWLWIILGVVVLFFLISIIYLILSNSYYKKINTKIKETLIDLDSLLAKKYEIHKNYVEQTKRHFPNEAKNYEEIESLDPPQGLVSIKEKQIISTKIDLNILLMNSFINSDDYFREKQDIIDLMNHFTETKENFESVRRIYNAYTSLYNQKIVVFPSNIIASIKKYSKKEFFESTY